MYVRLLLSLASLVMLVACESERLATKNTSDTDGPSGTAELTESTETSDLDTVDDDTERPTDPSTTDLDDDTGTPPQTDTGDAPTSDTDTDADALYPSVEDYIEAYCNAYLLRCGMYSAVEFCVDDVMSNWFSGNCVVQSQDSAGECIEWLEDLSCDKSGWLDACSDAIACN